MNREDRQVSDVRLRAAVESAPSGLLMIDPEGKIVLVNREVERLFGYSREELLGRSVDMLVPGRFQAQHPADRAAFLNNPRVRSMGAGRDLFGRRKDGTEVPVEIGLTPVATEEGLFVLSSVVDISARKRAEERFRVAVESSPNGVVMVDATGKIVLVNKEVERLFGYSREELLGQPIDMLVPQRSRDQHPGFRQAFFKDPQARSMGAGRELFGVRKDGTEVPVEIGLNPIETEEGLFVLSSIVDISARQKAAQEQRRLEEELRHAQKLEAVGRLAGGIAHDFNNILGAIIGYAELARDATNEEARDADLNELIVAAARGKALVERILKFSRKQHVVRKTMDISGAVAEYVRLLRSTTPAAFEIRLHDQSRALRVLADPTSVQQVLMNLATNAAHAMGSGGVMEFSLEEFYARDAFIKKHPDVAQGPYVMLNVRDTGCGMDDATRARVFEPFFTTKANGHGSGLGLTMVHSVMRDHGGTVWIESQPGTGTNVTCLFPALSKETAVESPADQREIPRGHGERILYIDDEVTLTAIVERRLGMLGYSVRIANEPITALGMFRDASAEFDLVITDYSMPQMNGIEVARELRRLRADIPILLVTGYMDDFPLETIRQSGVTVILKKPVTQAELAAAVRSLLPLKTSAGKT